MTPYRVHLGRPPPVSSIAGSNILLPSSSSFSSITGRRRRKRGMCQCFFLPHSPFRIFSCFPSPPPMMSRRTLRSTSPAMHSNPSPPPLPSQHHQQPQEELQSQQQALKYHNQTKHSLTNGYARGPRGLDWANQPNPFLRFLSSPPLPLLHFPPLPGDSPLYHSLFSSFPSPPHPVSHAFLSRLLYDSLSLSAWKTTGLSTWSLRVNPSSGNLHPTEAHLLSPPLPDDNSPFSSSPFLAHYSPKDHSLELRARLDTSSLFPHHGGPVLLLVLSSIFWREAWKYGERALRYCNHDAGHALAAVALAAASLGWDARLLDVLGHDDLDRLLGLHRANLPPPSQLPDRPVRGRFPWVESQHPDCALLLFPFSAAPSVDPLLLRLGFLPLKTLPWFLCFFLNLDPSWNHRMPLLSATPPLGCRAIGRRNHC